MKRIFICLLFCGLASIVSANFSDDYTVNDVKKVCNAVADWHLAHPGMYGWTNWTTGAEYSGLVEWAEYGGDKYFRKLKFRAGLAGWKLGRAEYFADDHAVGWYYLELYRRYGRERMMADVKKVFDYVLDNPPDVDLAFDPDRKERYKYYDLSQKRWSWCDSLFMAPPVWFNLYDLTKDVRYLDYANAEWWATTDYLFDESEDLYFRDSRFFDQREANGEKIFWGRGNGWVFAGLIKVLKYFPADHPDRVRYEELFQKMAARLAGLQDQKGYWHASLLDPESYPNPESSSTGFFCYGFAAGINMGLLDAQEYLPVVNKAWSFLVSAVHPNGMMGWVQAIGEDPRDVKFGDTETYGAGAFLHTGAQIYQLVEKGILVDE
ncbi:MAG: glycoside hydrolase family 88 protein [Spirochaetales bacterium]|nr:glycoside hydrolase family 88 protein [Spirochaetales bacterium]